MKWIRQCADWLRDHPWVGTAFFAGALVGLLICLPLVPFELPDSSANLVGAALGAVFAVWGAAWVGDQKERKQQRNLARAVRSTVEPTLMQVETLRRALEGELAAWPGLSERQDRIARIQALLPQADAVEARLVEMEKRVEFLIPIFLQMGGHGAIAHGQLEKTGPAIRQSLSTLRWSGFYDELPVMRHDVITFARDTRRTIRSARKALDLLRRMPDPHLPRAVIQ